MTNEERQKYEYSLRVNEEYINLLKQVNRVSVTKHQWELPVLTLFAGDKEVVSFELNSIPRKGNLPRIAQSRIASEIKRVETINKEIRQELSRMAS